MSIQDLPPELLSPILLLATTANVAETPSFTYGITSVPPDNNINNNTNIKSPSFTKYVRGPVTPDAQLWDASHAIRHVCSKWHRWAQQHCFRNVYERHWQRAERWADLTMHRHLFPLYELNTNPRGCPLYRDPAASLKHTHRLLHAVPSTAIHIRRLCFHGFHSADTERLILSVVAQCPHLDSLSVPWTVVRRGTVDDWVRLLRHDPDWNDSDHADVSPLRSLELTSVALSHDLAAALEADRTPNPLRDPRVSLASLHRLRLFGNTPHQPLDDADLHLMARTATRLRALDCTNLSTITVAGLLTLVRAASSTLRTLEHAPRSDDGFHHPHPGSIPPHHHPCALLATALPHLRDLSISLPTLCPTVFAHPDSTAWTGDCQIRTAALCSSASSPPAPPATRLAALLAAARALLAARHRLHHHLALEIFFAGRIFEPHARRVHGDWTGVRTRAHRLHWPASDHVGSGDGDGGDGGAATSTKGPYGTSGVYDKEEGAWEMVSEEAFLAAVKEGWVVLPE